MSGTVTSQAMGFPLAQGRRVVPSVLLLLFSIRLTGSLTSGICARAIMLLVGLESLINCDELNVL